MTKTEPVTTMGGCNCLCIITHPDQHGICEGRAVTEVPFSLRGHAVRVAMCGPCAEAAEADRSPGESDD